MPYPVMAGTSGAAGRRKGVSWMSLPGVFTSRSPSDHHSTAGQDNLQPQGADLAVIPRGLTSPHHLRLRHLPPSRLTTTRVNSEERDVPVLDEPLPGAPGLAASPELRVQEVEQGSADLSDLQVPESGLDHPPDVDLVRLPG